MDSEKIDYKKLTVKELKELMGRNPKADEEFDRRVSIGEIKLRRVNFDDIEKVYGINKNK